jgi:NADPH:quinone reductase-like Zn-dependent oxidoreductase
MTVKAILYHRYGPPDVLAYKEIEKPTPKDDEVLIKVRAASVNPVDWHFMRGTPYFLRMMAGLREPKMTRLGTDVAGEVEAVGRKVAQFKAGDEVFGTCRGSLSEYACTAESSVVVKPDSVTFEQAASAPVAALTALQGLRNHGHIQPGQKVLINGAAGGVGTFAVQIAKWLGAEVTGVCSTRNVEMVRSIGADQVIDYTRQDFTKSGQVYDVILDNIGNHPFSECRRILKPNGTFVVIGGPSGAWMIGAMLRLLARLVLSRFAGQKFAFFVARSNKEDLTRIGELIRSGKITPIIDRRYPLAEASEAIRYLETGHARGKVVITT